jgi:hypothetical protein
MGGSVNVSEGAPGSLVGRKVTAVRATDRPTRFTDEPDRAGGPFGWIGAAVLLTATAAADGLPASHAPARILMLAAVVGCCAAALVDVRVTLALAGFAYVLATGLWSQQAATTSVTSAEGLWNLTVLGLAAGLGLGQRWIRATLADLDIDAELRDLINDAEAGAGSEGRMQ